MRVIPTGYGARLVHGRSYLSKVLREPGPTHEVFDVLAAVVATAPAGAAALLGFAGGSLIAPLRAAGDRRAIRAVDLDPTGEPVFRKLCGRWCGSVRFERADAVSWLRACRRRWPVIVEDLSTDGPDGATKPPVSLDDLPQWIRRRLTRSGWLVANVLPVDGMSTATAIDRMTNRLPDRIVITMRDHDNRVVIASRTLPATRELANALRATMRAIGSRQERRIRVRTLPARGQNTNR